MNRSQVRIASPANNVKSGTGVADAAKRFELAVFPC